MRNIDTITNNIQAGCGTIPCDTVIKNIRIFHLSTGEFEIADIGIMGEDIVGIGQDYHGKKEIDGTGLTAVPGFIDAHVHLESSMIRPYEFERCVLPHGTTSAVCDPHELANITGTDAFDYFEQCAKKMQMSLHVHLSSCIPSTTFETSGYEITAEHIKKYAANTSFSGLAEVMNVPGITSCNNELLKKLAYFPENAIDGHAPLLSGKNLNGYIAAGIRNDHECSNQDEAKEKLQRGMMVFIREGTVARNLDALLPLITIENSMSISFCTDDRNPCDIAECGHIDNMIRRALTAGCPPLAVYRASSLSPARQFGFINYGLIAPGYKADLVLLSNFAQCQIHSVYKHGKLVNQELFDSRPVEPSYSFLLNSIKCRKVIPQDFISNDTDDVTHVIGIKNLSLITDDLIMDLPRDKQGRKQVDLSQDVIKIAVLERHGRNGNIAVGFVKNSGIKNGAIASSIGHDSHNICVIGSDDEQIATAVNQLIDQQGGFVVVTNNEVTGKIPLPLAGLISPEPAENIAHAITLIKEAAIRTGCTLTEPFLQLAFLPLPVIPFLKITDLGVIDTTTMTFVHKKDGNDPVFFAF